MTNTYLIRAWCVRPFIASIDPVEADTPEEAIAIARKQPAKLLDSAEECNSQYAWDEFAAFDEHGNELLHALDDKARLEDAAPALLDALLAIRAALQRHPQWQRSMVEHLLDLADTAITQANGGPQ